MKYISLALHPENVIFLWIQRYTRRPGYWPNSSRLRQFGNRIIIGPEFGDGWYWNRPQVTASRPSHLVGKKAACHKTVTFDDEHARHKGIHPPNSQHKGTSAMQSTRSLIVGASLGALISLGASSGAEAKQTADDVTQKEIQALRDQIEALQRRLDAQDAADQQTKNEAAAASAKAAAAQAQVATVPSQVQAQVKTAVDAAKPKTDKIYFKGVTITPGGFVEAASIYRSRNTNNDISTGFSAIPYNNVPMGHTGEFLFTARQSRVSALVEGDPNPETHLKFYTEWDLQGAAQTANSKESNSYNPRLRHMFGSIDWDDLGLQFLAGQAWSLVTLNSHGIIARNELVPPTIDGQYLPGFTWARQPQVRLVKNFDKQVWLGLSLENPQTTFYTGANPFPSTVHLTYQVPGTGTGYNTANNYSLNHIPDVVAKIAADPMVGDREIHLEAYGLYSQFYERLNYSNESTNGGGVGGGLILPLMPKLLDFQFSGLAGKGIGRYGSGQLTEVTFDPAGNIQPIHEIMMLAGLTLHATPTLDTYLFAGQERESSQPYNLTVAGVVTPYGYGNPLYSNAGCASETAVGACVANARLVEQATAGFWHKPYIGSYGMIRWGLQYSHTELKAFAGQGGSPVAIDNVVLASFRYYPFNN